MKIDTENRIVRRRIATYIGLSCVLAPGFVLDSHLTGLADWRSSVEFHTLMETVATLLAAMVGVMALVRFHSKHDSIVLFIGVGFLGTAFLDGYHAVVTSAAFKDYFPSALPTLIPWSWFASRLFLSVLLWLSWLAWRREERLGAAGRISERSVYATVGALTLASFLFFDFVPLPPAYFEGLIFHIHRPEEFVPAVFFALALMGYLQKGKWQHDVFEHWVVLCLMISLLGQAAFMPFSAQLFDMSFDAAHMLKKLSYVCVLVGLMISMYHLFRQEAEVGEALRRESARVKLQNSIASAAGEAATVEKMMQICIDGLCAHMGWPVGHVYMFNPSSDKMVPSDIWCLADRDRFATLRRVTHDIHFSPGMGIPGRVRATGKPLWITDVAADPDFLRTRMAEDLGVTSAFAFPIALDGEVIFVMEFFSVERREADDALFELAANVATQLGRVAERKQAADTLAESHSELEIQTRELERSNAELNDFAYVASHDLKEPLRGIHNYANFLLEDYGEKFNEDGRAKLTTLTRLTQRMEDIISDLLSFSRLGRTELGIDKINLDKVVREVVDSVHIALEERGVKVKIPRTLPIVKCDKACISEVFRNLITNAGKYNEKPEKWVEIGYRDGPPQDDAPGSGNGDAMTANGTVFYVRDNGIGIRDKHQGEIFRMFKRLHGRDAFGGGTGAGLSIVKKIIEKHGGQIWVESEYGVGTTFYFTMNKGQSNGQNFDTAVAAG